MRLNHDCIRDILLYVEKYTTDEDNVIEVDTLISDLSSKYDTDTINYHIRQIDKAGLVDDVFYSEGIPESICTLSWEGHSYVDNIRDNKIWTKVKSVKKDISSVALPILVEYIKKVIFNELPKS